MSGAATPPIPPPEWSDEDVIHTPACTDMFCPCKSHLCMTIFEREMYSQGRRNQIYHACFKAEQLYKEAKLRRLIASLTDCLMFTTFAIPVAALSTYVLMVYFSDVNTA